MNTKTINIINTLKAETFATTREKAETYASLILYLSGKLESIYRDSADTIRYDDDEPNLAAYADAMDSLRSSKEISRNALSLNSYVIKADEN